MAAGKGCRCTSAAATSSARFRQRWRRCSGSGCRAVEVPAIVAVELGLPGRYVQGYGDSDAPYDYKDFSLFAQDDWRISDRLTAKVGVRYQVQFWDDITHTVTGYPTPYPFPTDRNNIAPRLGLAWNPIGDRQNDRARCLRALLRQSDHRHLRHYRGHQRPR